MVQQRQTAVGRPLRTSALPLELRRESRAPCGHVMFCVVYLSEVGEFRRVFEQVEQLLLSRVQEPHVFGAPVGHADPVDPVRLTIKVAFSKLEDQRDGSDLGQRGEHISQLDQGGNCSAARKHHLRFHRFGPAYKEGNRGHILVRIPLAPQVVITKGVTMIARIEDEGV
eukprot:4309199-Prymnesium_polylepis.2